jgi:hypothetical protein
MCVFRFVYADYVPPAARNSENITFSDIVLATRGEYSRDDVTSSESDGADCDFVLVMMMIFVDASAYIGPGGGSEFEA